MKTHPDIHAIREAAVRIGSYIHCTPILTSRHINDRLDAVVLFKCENFQKTGSFKFRGACNAVFSLSDHLARRGVITHSSGNHAAALALAAEKRRIKAFIIMPRNAPAVKRNAVAEYGGEISWCDPTLAAREFLTKQIQEETQAVFVHPYNDLRIVSGQGTIALEFLGAAPDLDIVMVPVGGGGLLSGTALCVSNLSSMTEVVAAEPEGADDAFRSLRAGKIIPCNPPRTIADGLRTSLGGLTFPIIQRHVREIVTVSEEAIIHAMRLVWERMKIVIEPSAAVPLAALLDRKPDVKGKRVGVILTGGNVDLDDLPWI